MANFYCVLAETPKEGVFSVLSRHRTRERAERIALEYAVELREVRVVTWSQKEAPLPGQLINGQLLGF